MKKFENAKKAYNNIIIPDELSNLVEETIEQHKKMETKKKLRNYFHYPLVTAAAIVVCFTIALNTSYSFAKSVENIPIIGVVAKVLTIHSYEEKDMDKTTKVKVPAISNNNKTSESAIKDINNEINKKVNEYVKQANKDIEEYKQAFLETGGTEKEWQEHNIKVNVDYEIKSQTKDYVSFVITGYEDWNSAYIATYYYNIDLHTGDEITLKKMLGENFVQTVNNSIKSQIKERKRLDKDVSYFSEEEGGFVTIDKNTNFYISDKGNPVIVFGKYEIAPGFMGEQEFEIKK